MNAKDVVVTSCKCWYFSWCTNKVFDLLQNV